MSAAARILIVIPFQCCCQVCMARTRHSCELAVVRRFRIHVPEHNRQRSTSGTSLIHTAHEHRPVLLYTRSRALGSALAAGQILHEVLLGQFDARLHAVQHHTDELAMRLTEYRHSEFSTECIHICFCYLIIHQRLTHSPCSPLTARTFRKAFNYCNLRSTAAKMSWNCGKDLATHASSSMVIGLSAPREATFRAMTMRWSWWEV